MRRRANEQPTSKQKTGMKKKKERVFLYPRVEIKDTRVPGVLVLKLNCFAIEEEWVAAQ